MQRALARDLPLLLACLDPRPPFSPLRKSLGSENCKSHVSLILPSCSETLEPTAKQTPVAACLGTRTRASSSNSNSSSQQRAGSLAPRQRQVSKTRPVAACSVQRTRKTQLAEEGICRGLILLCGGLAEQRASCWLGRGRAEERTGRFLLILTEQTAGIALSSISKETRCCSWRDT